MFELSLMCPEDRIEAVSDALDALDALSVSVEDADADTDADYIVVELAKNILGDNWMAEYVNRANTGSIERVLL